MSIIMKMPNAIGARLNGCRIFSNRKREQRRLRRHPKPRSSCAGEASGDCLGLPTLKSVHQVFGCKIERAPYLAVVRPSAQTSSSAGPSARMFSAKFPQRCSELASLRVEFVVLIVDCLSNIGICNVLLDDHVEDLLNLRRIVLVPMLAHFANQHIEATDAAPSGMRNHVRLLSSVLADMILDSELNYHQVVAEEMADHAPGIFWFFDFVDGRHCRSLLQKQVQLPRDKLQQIAYVDKVLDICYTSSCQTFSIGFRLGRPRPPAS